MMLEKGHEDGVNSGLGLIKGEVKYMGEINSTEYDYPSLAGII